MSEEARRPPGVVVLRIAWATLFLFSVYSTASTAWGPVPDLGCSKIGELGSAGGPSDATCDSSAGYVFGVWPFFVMGMLLGVPAQVAAIFLRQSISWLAFAAYCCVSVTGLVNWTGRWGMLLVAVPMAVAALALAIAHRIATGRQHATSARIAP